MARAEFKFVLLYAISKEPIEGDNSGLKFSPVDLPTSRNSDLASTPHQLTR